MICEIYDNLLAEETDLSVAVLAVKAMCITMRQDPAETVQEFSLNRVKYANSLKNHSKNPIAVQAGCHLFAKFSTSLQVTHELETYKNQLFSYADTFIENSVDRRQKIAEIGLKFIPDGAIILIHSYSRVVMALLLNAKNLNVRFQVFVTESRPSSSGEISLAKLKEADIPSMLILDSAVGYYIGRVDMVLVGAEAVVENGGIIGTYQIAVVSKAANKPFYVVTECHKFVQLFPLNQYDIHDGSDQRVLHSHHATRQKKYVIDEDIAKPENIIRTDYTPPHYITLLFTDWGVLTPSAAADELIKLFH